MNAYAEFWAVPVADVPSKTGAQGLEDCADIRDVLDHLGLDLTEHRVLDVGCGTGRVAQLCGGYVGCDVSIPMVAYTQGQGCEAYHIEGPAELGWADIGHFATCTCLSVFTHISRDDRVAYLKVFRRLADELLVDILPGDQDEGGIAYWVADTERFELDLNACGFEIEDSYLRVCRDGTGHLYFHCR